MGYPAPGPHIRPSTPSPLKYSTSLTYSNLKSTQYDQVLRVYGLFKPCWLTHATCTCFKETVLLFNVHLSCFVNFILFPIDKYMFKVNQLVFGNCGSSIYCQNNHLEKVIYFLTLMSCSTNKVLHVIHVFQSYVEKTFLLHEMVGKEVVEGLTPLCLPPFSLALYYEHIMNKYFSSKLALRIPSVLLSFLYAIWSALSSLFPRHLFCCIKTKVYLNHWKSEITW